MAITSFSEISTTVHDHLDPLKTVHSYYGLDQTADFPGDAVIKRSISLIILFCTGKVAIRFVNHDMGRSID